MLAEEYVDYEKYIDSLKTKPLEEIDHLLMPSRWSPRLPSDKIIQAHCDAINKANEKTANVLRIEANIKYGSSERQAYDILTLNGIHNDSPVFVFFHGGYWQAHSRQQYYFIAEQIASMGGIYITVGYDLAPNATLTGIVKQASFALSSIVQKVVSHGCKNIYLAGHSAGAHLALTAATTNQDLPTINHYIKGFILFSGVYDARPLYLSSENKCLRMTNNESCTISPLVEEIHLRNITNYLGHASYTIIAAEHDPPMFKYQSKEFYQLLKKVCINQIELIIEQDTDHFDIIEHLSEPNDRILKKIIKITGMDKMKSKKD